MLPSVAELLELPDIRRGNPIVLAGEKSLDRLVRWIHVSEIADIGSMLRGGEVVLTTGVALPRTSAELRTYVKELAEANVAGLFVGLGRVFERCPTPIVNAALEYEMPLVEFRSTIPFVQVTETVHSLIVNRRAVELKLAEKMHDTFSNMELEGASLSAILRETATLMQTPIVLEDLSHRVLAYNPLGKFDEEILFAWEEKSRNCVSSERSGYFQDIGWLTTLVGARGETWARLVAVVDEKPQPFHKLVLERAASAVAIHRLLERDGQEIESEARRALLTDILDRAYSSQEELKARAAAIGVKVNRRLMTPVVVRLLGEVTRGDGPSSRFARDAVRAVEDAAAPFADSVLVAATSDDTVALLVTRDVQAVREVVLRPLATAVHGHLSRLQPSRRASIGVAEDVTSMGEVARGILEASEIAEAGRDNESDMPYVELPDVHVRGMLFLLRHDARVQSFIERQLGPLLALEPGRRRDLLEALKVFLDSGRNKSLAADLLHMSRPALYHRLRSIEQLLQVELDDVEACLSLHVALVAYEER